MAGKQGYLLHKPDSMVKSALSVEFTKSQIVASIPETFFCIWYASKKHWLANNVLGVAFCIQDRPSTKVQGPPGGDSQLNYLFGGSEDGK